MTAASPAVPAAAPIDCETAVRRLWDFLDGRLAAPSRAEVEAHLAACAQCPPHFDFARGMRRGLAAARAPGPDADDEAALRRRVRAALQAARCDAGPPGTPNAPNAPTTPDA